MTIFALSSGPGISGISVIRISGDDTKKVIKSLTDGNLPTPRVATLKKFNKINSSEVIDQGILLWFPGPESYTGEDMAEIQVHGSKAVIDAFHETISKIQKKKPKPVLKSGVAQQAEELLKKTDISYYKIPVEYEIKGNFLGYIKFKRSIAKSNKMLNFDKETISIVQNDSTGAIIAQGELTIVGIPDEFF